MFREGGIVVVVFGNLSLFNLFVRCFGKCMMSWFVVFIWVEIDKNVVVVVGRMGVIYGCVGDMYWSWVSVFVGW